jgi:hypothetical protein
MEQALRNAIEESRRSLSAHIGEVEDKLDRGWARPPSEKEYVCALGVKKPGSAPMADGHQSVSHDHTPGRGEKLSSTRR